LVPDLIKSASIALLCSIPISWFLGNEMRKNEDLTLTLRNLVNRDRLTDAATRDYFFDRMDAEPDSYGVSLMIDIDHFKSVNDTYGHLAGDQVIRHVAKILRRSVREDDIVCRFGGEEFVVFLANQKTDDGVAIAEGIRKSIENEVIRLQETAISVTVSIGGSLKDALTDINNAISAADDALYQAKAAGRNQIRFA
jgi:diguanylate cyclase (GGDEF)-like protein